MCGIDQVLYQIDHAQVVIILQCISLNENGKKIDDKVKNRSCHTLCNISIPHIFLNYFSMNAAAYVISFKIIIQKRINLQ